MLATRSSGATSSSTSFSGPETGATNLSCVGCLLDFTTGPLDSVAGNIHIFSGGGTFVLTGTGVRLGPPLVASGVLLSGVFDDFVTANVNPIAQAGTGDGGWTRYEEPRPRCAFRAPQPVHLCPDRDHVVSPLSVPPIQARVGRASSVRHHQRRPRQLPVRATTAPWSFLSRRRCCCSGPAWLVWGSGTDGAPVGGPSSKRA